MNLLLVRREAVSERGDFSVEGRAAVHIKDVLKGVVGNVVKTGVINGQKGLAQIVSISSQNNNTNYILRLLPLRLRNAGLWTAYQQATGIVECPSLTSREVEFWKIHPHSTGLEVSDAIRTFQDTNLPFRDLDDSEVEKHGQAWHKIDCLTPEELMSTPGLIDVVVAMPRPKVFDRVLQSITSMKVQHIFIYAATRSEIAYLSSPKLSAASILENAIIGLEQSGLTVVPSITITASYNVLLEYLKQHITSEHICLAAHPYGVNLAFAKEEGSETFISPTKVTDASIGLINHPGPVLIMIGPEGGYTDGEIQSLVNDTRCHLVELGDEILKTEVAVIFLISCVKLLLTDENIRQTSAKRKYFVSEDSSGSRIRVPVKGRRS